MNRPSPELVFTSRFATSGVQPRSKMWGIYRSCIPGPVVPYTDEELAGVTGDPDLHVPGREPDRVIDQVRYHVFYGRGVGVYDTELSWLGPPCDLLPRFGCDRRIPLYYVTYDLGGFDGFGRSRLLW